ncbi:MAG: CpaD family pilus assembly lipoprotein [Holosporaceae bacterium]|jgi:type IV pilus biogenesis protein CpaD/CtpE|nr:CpaD family pilus assembly lipoprotein [Holosporaceae bacterium]
MMKILNLALICLLLIGCEKQYLANDGYVPETIEIEAKEVKDVHFFATPRNFVLDKPTTEAVNKLLKDARAEGIENIGFMLTSDRVITVETQEKAKKQISQLMIKHGFLNSRIINSGACVYKDAKVGFRIDILRYDVKEPNCSTWSEYIGDLDTNKHMPKYGAAAAYNLIEMISNKADFVSPRKYSGPEVSAAVNAARIKSSGGGGGGGSSSGSSAASSSN